MEQVFIFDVDGTLTGPRRRMQAEFSRFFRSVVSSAPVYLVSGSNMAMLEQQLPKWLLHTVAGTYSCSGNELWCNGTALQQMHHVFPDELHRFGEKLIRESTYGPRTGNHMETRTGTLNISVIGRNANSLQRNDYDRYDAKCGDRQRMITAINDAFEDYEASLGGQISIDVSPRGWNKSRVYTDLCGKYHEAVFHFFGDNICKGGNDLPLAEAIMAGNADNRVYPVVDHLQTMKILQEEFMHLWGQDHSKAVTG